MNVQHNVMYGIFEFSCVNTTCIANPLSSFHYLWLMVVPVSVVSLCCCLFRLLNQVFFQFVRSCLSYNLTMSSAYCVNIKLTFVCLSGNGSRSFGLGPVVIFSNKSFISWGSYDGIVERQTMTRTSWNDLRIHAMISEAEFEREILS